jgi:hypothetical protein
MHIFYNFCYTELEEKRMLDHMLTSIPFKNFDRFYSRVGSGAGVGAGAAGTGAMKLQNFRTHTELLLAFWRARKC